MYFECIDAEVFGGWTGGLSGSTSPHLITVNSDLSIGASWTVISTSSIPRDGLIAEYLFNGNADDTAGVNNGTVSGAILTTDRFGQPGNAYEFTSNGQKISIGSLNAYSGSVSLWFKTTKDQGVLFCGNDQTNPYVQVGNWWTNTADESITYGASPYLVMTERRGEFFYRDDAWHMVTVNIDGVDNSIYMDGVKSSVSYFFGEQTTQDTFVGSTQLNFGYYDGSAIYDFVGILDDIRFYNRSLSASEVAALYAEGN